MSTTTAEPFTHPALLYSDDDEYLAGTVPYIREGLAIGEPVAVAVPADRLALIRDALGADAERVLLRDMLVAGRNPGRIIPTVLLAFANAHPGRRVRLIGEPIWAGRSATEYPACAQHEALINAAFTGRPATILCPYNTRLLNPAWIEDAYKTHPIMVDAGGGFDSVHYDEPVLVARAFNVPLSDPPPHAATLTVDLFALPAVRRMVTEHAQHRAATTADRRSGPSGERADHQHYPARRWNRRTRALGRRWPAGLPVDGQRVYQRSPRRTNPGTGRCPRRRPGPAPGQPTM